MKRNLGIIVLIVLVVAGGIYAWMLTQGDSKTVEICDKSESELAKEFAVKDTANVDKVVISDTRGNRITVVRDGYKWNFKYASYDKATKSWNEGEYSRARQDVIELLLKTFYRIELNNYVAKNAKETVIKQTSADHKQVDIYQNGELTKTWYVGIPTASHYGTYMLIELPGCGRSKDPYEMGMKAFNGTLSVRFFTTPEDWSYTGLWSEQPGNLASVSITSGVAPEGSFTIKLKSDNEFSLFDMNGDNVGVFDTSAARNLFVSFRKLHFDRYDKDLTEAQKDSIRTQAPLFFKIETVTKDGKKMSVRTTKIKMPPNSLDMAGHPIDYDVNHIYGILPNGDVVRLQYFVFGHLFHTIDRYAPKAS